VQDRDRELLKQVRQVIARSTAFVERAESGEMGELAFAGALTVLTSAYRDTADELGARAGALYATHPWSSLAQPGQPPTVQREGAR
jgi:hypothetical protein